MTMVCQFPAPDFWRQRRVFLTGHTGFKGGWLALWLHQLGAEVIGYALRPDTESESLFVLANIAQGMHSVIGDIRDVEHLSSCMKEAAPDIVLHLAAQPLVRASYADPLTTYSTNVMGTANVLEAARHIPSIRAVQIITTDKCYENHEWDYPYRETDTLGGRDPYSNSKACAELVTDCYRQSFMLDASISVASSRAGNVIGGGDWAADRIVPDCIRALLQGGGPEIRFPHAVRPWQHVLEPLCGYLLLAEHQFQGVTGYATAFNFGPPPEDEVSVGALASAVAQCWGGGQQSFPVRETAVHEAGLLKLDSSKARKRLGWLPRWDFETTIFNTVDWYRRVLLQGQNARLVCLEQLAGYQSISLD